MKHYSNRVIIDSLNLPVLTCFEDIVKEVRLDANLIYWLTKRDAYGKYKTFYIDKKDGTQRKINAPVLSVKLFQRWILENILYKIRTSQYSYGFEKKMGSPLVRCAEMHKNNLYVLKIDLKNFYPSIDRKRVFGEFVNIGYNDEVSDLLTNGCVLDDKLPQGAVTSAYLANLICRKLDSRIAGYCNKRNIVYTRYADDLTFSCDDRELLKRAYRMVKMIVEDEGFALNQKKTIFMTPKCQKRVLGITINDNLIKAPRETKRMIRAMLHYAVATGDYSMNNKIRGYIAYVDSIEKAYKKKCISYLVKLSKSNMSLFTNIVKAYNDNKIFEELPDMVEKQPIDFVQYEDVENYENVIYYVHEDYLASHGLVLEQDEVIEKDLTELFWE